MSDSLNPKDYNFICVILGELFVTVVAVLDAAIKKDSMSGKVLN
jgi:hypothetical protein